MERTKRAAAATFVAGPQARIWRNDPQDSARDRWPGRDGFRAGKTDRYCAGTQDRRATRLVQATRSVGGALAMAGENGDIALLGGKRILLVEDEPVLAIDAAMILDELGLDVIGPFATLSLGLASAKVELLDLAMLDVNLRGEMSYPIADVLSRRGVPLIFATGYDSIDWAGIAPRIGKPYSQHDIETALLSVIT